MASSSHKTLEGSIDETLINILIKNLIKQLRIYPLSMLRKKNAEKKEKNELISKEIVKKGIFVYGMIISVKFQRILKISSDDVLE